MSSFTYYLLWLLAGLLLVGLASALLARQMSRRVVQHAVAQRLLDALSRYSLWAAGLRTGTDGEWPRGPAEAALREARQLQAGGFPQLDAAMARLAQADRDLADFLRERQQLGPRDAEAWLDSDPPQRFELLWLAQQAALQAVLDDLQAAEEAPLFTAT